MRMKLGMLLTGAALMLIAFGCSVDNPTQPNTSRTLLRPTAVLQAPAIGDLVWMDANHNGIQDDPAEEPGLGGVTVRLFLCSDSSEVAVETTDSAGLYGFEDMEPGDYFVQFVLPQGYAFSPKDMGDNDSLDSDADTLTGYTDCISIDSGEVDLTWDAGMYALPPATATVGDLVWEDLNQNGILDSGETGLGGIEVRLISCDDTLMAERSTMTDPDGMYSFSDIEPGNYRLYVDLPDGYAFSPMDQGTNDSLDSDVNPTTGYTECMYLDSGEVNMDWNVGMYQAQPPTAIVGGYVWDDANMNGIQDSGEVAMPAIAVYLTTCMDGDTLMVEDTMMTDTGGYYAFMDVPAGNYKLHFALPMGYAFSPMDQGDDDMLDSEVDPMTGYTLCFTVEGGTDQLNWDAGMYRFTSGCTYSKGYWKTHAGFGPQADIVTPLLPIWLGNDGGDKSLAVTDAQIAFDVLQQHTYGEPSNGITKLYAQLLTVKLNMANGAVADTVADIVTEADDWLAMHDWMDWANLSKQDMKMVLHWKNMLEMYNEGEIGPGLCDEEGEPEMKSYRLGFRFSFGEHYRYGSNR